MISENVQTETSLESEVIDASDETAFRQVKTAKLSLKEIRNALGDTYKPIITLKEASAVGRMAANTLKKKVGQGHFKQSAKRGKPLLFWTDRFIQELMR